MGILEIFTITMKDARMNTAIFSSLFIMGIGYFCRKKEIFHEDTGKLLTTVILQISLPALAFRSFMVDMEGETLKQGMGVLVWGFFIHLLLIFLSKIIYGKYQGDEQDTLRVLSIFGATTVFGIPIVTAIYGIEGALYASIFNIGYRVFLYSYGYIKMSGLSMNQKNLKAMLLNPTLLATFFGLLIWLFQAHLPQVMVQVFDPKTGLSLEKQVAFLRIDYTIPQLARVLKYLADLCSPLAWLSIGSTLASVSFKKAITNKTTWYYTLVKLIMIPLCNLLLLIFFYNIGFMHLQRISLGTMVIMMATPPATVAVAYAIRFDKGAILSSNTSLLATLGAVFVMPIWIVLVDVVGGYLGFL